MAEENFKPIFSDKLNASGNVSCCADSKTSIFLDSAPAIQEDEQRRKYGADEECLQQINTLTSTQLREKYPREFNSWKNRTHKAKGKGYTIDPRFKTFKEFLKWMGSMPGKGYTLDRIDNDNSEYSPENCRWASKSLQSTNRSCAHLIKGPNGEKLSLKEWARRTGIPESTIRNRIRLGWDEQDAVCKSNHRRTMTTSQTIPASSLGAQWKRLVHLHHGLAYHLDTMHLKLLKEIASVFQYHGHDQANAFTCVVRDWVNFCVYMEKNWGSHRSPRYPRIETLRNSLTPALNFLRQTAKAKEGIQPTAIRPTAQAPFQPPAETAQEQRGLRLRLTEEEKRVQLAMLA